MTENRKRLIDASQENIKSVLGDSSYYPDEIWKFVAMAERFPTVDAVEVVRCRDCKHKGWIQEPCHGKSVDYCHFWDSCINDSEKDFCPYGQRKE